MRHLQCFGNSKNCLSNFHLFFNFSDRVEAAAESISLHNLKATCLVLINVNGRRTAYTMKDGGKF